MFTRTCIHAHVSICMYASSKMLDGNDSYHAARTAIPERIHVRKARDTRGCRWFSYLHPVHLNKGMKFRRASHTIAKLWT